MRGPGKRPLSPFPSPEQVRSLLAGLQEMTQEDFTDAFSSVFQAEATRTWLAAQPVDTKEGCVLIPFSEDWSSFDIFVVDLEETLEWAESFGGPEATQTIRDESKAGCYWAIGVIPLPHDQRIRLVVWSVRLVTHVKGGIA